MTASLSYTRDCRECGREFESPDKWAAFCPRCSSRIDAQNRNDVGRRATGFTHDMMRKGANRHAMRILKKGAA